MPFFSNSIRFNLIVLFSILFFNSNAQKSLQVFQLKSPIIIDGVFEPEKWAEADSATNFTQMEPHTGEPASERTVAYFGHDKKNIYAAIRCYQTTPVVAKNQSRDALSKNDDLIALIIDTYNDNRSGYVFFSNPLGTQIDTKINDDGRNMDINWDTEWKCEAKIYDWGWCAEFEIPFKSLKYKKGTENWGINFGRIIRSNFETSYWSGTLSDDFRISQSGVATGIETPGSKMKVSIFPYISVFKTTGEKISADAGGDVRWQISPNVSFNGTINPDFATVEADQHRINLSRYELRYPEKRLFFQEGNDMYNTRIKTFYSRRISDIDFGGRLNGKIGKTQFNILSVKTPDLSTDSIYDPTKYFTAARAKFDFLNSSSLGFTFVDKSWSDGFTRSLSLDYLLNLGKFWKLTGQFVGSSPGDFWDHSAWFMRFARENNKYHIHFRYTEIGKDFRENVNQTGFVTDDDRREMDADVTYKWWLKNNTFEYIHFQNRNNAFWSIENGNLRSWNFTNSINFYMKSKINFIYSYNNEYKLYEKDFYNFKHTFGIGYNTDEWSYATLTYTTGDNFDRNFNLISGGGQVKFFQNLSLSYSGNILKFNPDDDKNSTFINVVTANYNFTKDMWVKVFAQNSTKNDNIYFYGLAGWRFKPPFGALYLIYSHNQYGEDESLPNTDNFFIKLTYPISLLN
ncbi:MAG: carbohydrate binding family 9 domain-containing protein [Draconibacterium sp.]|nr:carbohydrate binding family 9 domain-containing protein [Draconibacterium sp.]